MYLIKHIPKTPSKIAIVAEAPGGEEWRSALRSKNKIGTPLIGQVGQHTGRLLKAAGMKKFDLFLTNTVHKKPHKNDYDSLSKEDLDFGLNELKKDLLEWKAQGLNLVIALGAKSLQATTGKTGIYKYRGTILPCSIVEGLKVLPTLHPGGLRPDRGGKEGPKAEPVVVLDFKKALKESDSSKIVYPERNIKIVRDIFEARALLKDFAHHETPLACDIETNKSKKRPGSGSLMTAYGIATSPREAFVFTKDILEAPSCLKLLAIFTRSQVKKIFHNALFDCFHNAYYYRMINSNIYFDTMLAQHDCYPNFSKLLKPNSLAFCGSIYTNEPYWKGLYDEAIGNVEIGGVIDWDKLYDYNGKDCCLTYEIYEALKAELTHWGVWEPFNLDMSLIPPVLFAMLKGILINKGEVKKFADKNERAIINLEKIKQAVFGDLNTKSHKQLKELIYDTWDMPRQYKKGKLTTEDKKLRKLVTFPTPYKRHIKLIRVINKKYGWRKFYDINTDPDGRVRTAQKIHGAYTGRWSSSAGVTGSGTNEQNRPNEVRHFYVPEPRKIMGYMDLSQSEARIVAALCRDLEWLMMFDVEDQHMKVAVELFGVPKEKITPDQRNKVAKRVAHASHYLLGWQLLSEILECSAKEAKAHKAKYLRMRPKLKYWHNYINTEIRKTRVIRTCFNRVIQFFGPFFDTMVTDATAAEPQSTSVSYLNTALARCYYEIPEFEFLLQGHDSILFQTVDDPGVFKKVVRQMKEITEQEIDIRGVKLMIPAEFEMGYSWGTLSKIKDVDDIENIYVSCKKQLAMR